MLSCLSFHSLFVYKISFFPVCIVFHSHLDFTGQFRFEGAGLSVRFCKSYSTKYRFKELRPFPSVTSLQFSGK